MQQLICPKCQGSMRQYERNGVHIDQCAECRGIFLDRGELERLIDAETAFHAPAPSAARSDTRHDDTRRDDRDRRYEDQRRYEEQRRYEDQSRYGHQPHRKRKSFLSELFD
jgi:Zn-finger nucleic acid-binding protein